MPRIDEQYLNSVCFLYPSKAEARKGTKYGGSGFFISAPSKTRKCLHYYIVTNKHVIDGGNLTVRLETTDGKDDYLETKNDEWIKAKDDDIATLHWTPGCNHKFRAIKRGGDKTEFLDKDWISADGLGSGDDVFMIGRFITHKGEQIDIPTTRFGTLSAGRTVSILNSETSQNQESLIVEVRSMKGYSGSPVFIYRPPYHYDPVKVGVIPELFGPWLLGIMWGYNVLPIKAEQMTTKTKKPTGRTYWQLHPNTGMMNVVPVWKLANLLDSPEVTKAQEQFENEDIMSNKEYAEAASDNKERQFTRDDYTRKLNKVVRKKRRRDKKGR